MPHSARSAGSAPRSTASTSAPPAISGSAGTDLHLIDRLRSEGPQTPSELARSVGLTSGGLSIALERLERIGYIRRSQHPDDRRSVLVEATDAIVPLENQVFGPLIREMRSLLATYDDRNLATIRDYLDRAATIISQSGPGASPPRKPPPFVHPRASRADHAPASKKPAPPPTRAFASLRSPRQAHGAADNMCADVALSALRRGRNLRARASRGGLRAGLGRETRKGCRITPQAGPPPRFGPPHGRSSDGSPAPFPQCSGGSRSQATIATPAAERACPPGPPLVAADRLHALARYPAYDVRTSPTHEPRTALAPFG